MVRLLILAATVATLLVIPSGPTVAQEPWPSPDLGAYQAVGRVMPLDGAIDWATEHGFAETDGADGVDWTGLLGQDAAVTFTADGNVVTRTTIFVAGDAVDVSYLREWLALTGGTGAPADFGNVVERAMSAGVDTERTILLPDRVLVYSAMPSLLAMAGSMSLTDRVDQRPDLGQTVPDYAADGEPPFFLGSPPSIDGPVEQVAHTDLFHLDGGRHAFWVFASGGPYECQGSMNLAGHGEWYPIASWDIEPGDEFDERVALDLQEGTYSIAIVSTCYWRVGIDGGGEF